MMMVSAVRPDAPRHLAVLGELVYYSERIIVTRDMDLEVMVSESENGRGGISHLVLSFENSDSVMNALAMMLEAKKRKGSKRRICKLMAPKSIVPELQPGE